MPRPYSLPYLFDELKQINISDLKRWNYLTGKKKSSGVLTWSVRGEKTGSINFLIDTTEDTPYMDISYTSNNQSHYSTIYLTKIKSNLNTGFIWLFICPYTGKTCRKLYFKDGKFAHREAHTNCMYQLQTFSKKDRDLVRLMTPKFKSEQLHSELYSKHFKRVYAGKPTKRYQKIASQLRIAEKISSREFHKALLS